MNDLELGVADGIATVTLSRPPVNALSARMIGELVDLLRRLDRDDAVRVIVLDGSGRRRSGVNLTLPAAAAARMAGMHAPPACSLAGQYPLPLASSELRS